MHPITEYRENRSEGKATEAFLRERLIAGLPRGTRGRLLPLLPSGPDGVHNLPLRGTQLSAIPVKHEAGTPRPPVACRQGAEYYLPIEQTALT